MVSEKNISVFLILLHLTSFSTSPNHCYEFTSQSSSFADSCGGSTSAAVVNDGNAPFCSTGGCSFYDNSVIRIDPAPAMPLQFTILLWSFQYDTSSLLSLFSITDSSHNVQFNLDMTASSGRLKGQCGGSSAQVAKDNINKSTWSYIYIFQTANEWEVGSFVTINKENIFYYNGVSSSCISAGSSYKMYLGAKPASSSSFTNQFSGLIRRFEIFTSKAHTRQDNELLILMSQFECPDLSSMSNSWCENLVIYYELSGDDSSNYSDHNGKTDQKINDLSGNNNYANRGDGYWVESKDPSMYYIFKISASEGLVFSASDEADIIGFDLSSSFTMEMWFKTGDYGNNSGKLFLSKRNASNRYPVMQVYFRASSRKLRVVSQQSSSSSAIQINSSELFSSGRSDNCCWDHVVVSWAAWTETSSMVYAWFNGDLVIEEVINSKLLVPDSDAEGELGEDWKGTIRKFKLYDAPRGSELMAYWYIDSPLCASTGQYLDVSDNTCKSCHALCQTCSGPTSSQCSTCVAIAEKIVNTCVCAGSNYWNDGTSTCKACNAACATCTTTGSTNCLTCATNYKEVVDSDPTHRDCRSSCPNTGYFQQNSQCIGKLQHSPLECDSTCKTCTGTAANQCSTCYSSPASQAIKKTDGTCGSGCGTNEVQLSSVCYACGNFCNGCTAAGSNSACSSCDASAYQTAANTCAASCPTGWSYDSSNVCYQCNAACNGCIGGAVTQCVNCKTGYKEVVDGDAASKWCANSTPSQYYDNTSNYLACVSPCLTCTGPTNDECIECASGKYLTAAGSCRDQCNPDQYPDSSNVCQACDGSCDGCTDTGNTNCKACNGAYKEIEDTLAGVRCESNCVDGYYEFSSTLCKACDDTCLTCSGPSATQCASCGGATYPNLKNDNSCSLTCDSNQIAVANVCQDCGTHCNGCSEANNNDKCTACGANKVQIDTGLKCRDNCDPGDYPDSNNICQACDGACATCSDTGNKKCDTCTPGYMEVIDQDPSARWCVQTTCPNGYYPFSSTECRACDQKCLTCTGATNDDCTDCASGKFLIAAGSCRDQCNANQYPDSSNVCQTCDVSCDGCTDTGNTNCKACDSSYIEIGDTLAGVRCESDCVDGYYQHSSTLCKACDDTCLTCTGPSTTECASCGGATHPNLKDDKSCSLTCDSNQIAVANVCQDCGTHCNGCSEANNNDKCTACGANKVQIDTGLKCRENCDPGDYPDANNICQTCDGACATCYDTGNKQCETCETGYMEVIDLDPSARWCVQTTCPNGYYPHSATQCRACDGTCLTCTGPSTTECATCGGSTHPNLKDDNSCSLTCDANQIAVANVCQDCGSHCNGCTVPADNDACTVCAADKFLISANSCRTQCNADQYPDASNICQPCDGLCNGCTGSGNLNCKACSGSNKQIEDAFPEVRCEASCITGYFEFSSSLCKACDNTCLTCNGTGPNDCVTCDGSSAFPNLKDDKSCSATCDNNQVPESNVCQDCSSFCNGCTASNDATQCTACASDKYMDLPSTCVTQCNNDQAPNANRICQSCDGECDGCTAFTNDDCSACKPPAKPLSDAASSCRTNKPVGYFDGTTEWTKCDSSCLTCSGVTPQNCQSCDSGLYLHPNTSECLPSAAGYFADSSDNTLKPCFQIAQGCLECTGVSANECTSCDASIQWYLDSTGNCINCPLPQLIDANGDCQECTILGFQYTQSGCEEVRGDGLNMGAYECDDHNLEDGDGCSAQGTIQPGYVCTGGSATSKDVCSLPPSITNHSYDPYTQLVLVEFSEPVILTDFSLQDIQISSSSEATQLKFNSALLYPSPKYTSGSDEYYTHFYIRVEPTESIESNDQKLEIQILNPNKIQSDKNIPIQEPSLQEITLPPQAVLSEQQKAILNAAGSSVQAATLSLLFLLTVAQVFVKFGCTSMWGLVNYIQLVFFIPLMSVYFPSNVYFMFKFLNFVHGQLSILVWVYQRTVLRLLPDLFISPYNQFFQLGGYDSERILYDAGIFICMWLIILILLIPCCVWRCCSIKKSNSYRCSNKCLNCMLYGNFLRTLLETHIELLLVGAINIYGVSFSTYSDALSFSFSLFMVITMLYLPFLLINVLSQDQQVLTSKKFQEKYGPLYMDLAFKRGFYPVAFTVVFVLRRIFVVWVLIVLTGFPYTQISLHIVVTLWKLSYLRAVKPFQARSDQCLAQFNNIGLLVLYLLVFPILHYNEKVKLTSYIGWLMIGIVVLWNMINFLVILVVMLINCKEKCKKSKKKKKAQKKYLSNGWTANARRNKLTLPNLNTERLDSTIDDLNRSTLEDSYEWRSYAIKATKETRLKKAASTHQLPKTEGKEMRFKPLD